MFNRLSAAVAAFIIFISASAAAENFTTSDIQNFIKIGMELDGMEERYPGLEEQLGLTTDDPNALTDMLDDNGKLRVFTQAFSRLPEGSARQEISSAVKRNGYSSISSFTTIADDIMMAYLAITMEGEDLSMIDQLDDATISQMPVEMRTQMLAVKKMINAVRNVPSSDIQTLRPMMDALEASMT